MKKLLKNEKGFGTLEAILIVIIIVLLGTVGYLVYKDRHKTATVVTKTVIVTSKSSSATNSNKSSSNSTQYLNISEWGVRLPLSSDIMGITYTTSVNGDVQTAAITVPNSKCTPMASIYRGSASDTDPTTAGFDGGGSTFQANNDKQIGQYYYSFATANGSTCFPGEQMMSGTSNGVQTEAVYSQLKTAFENMSATSSN